MNFMQLNKVAKKSRGLQIYHCMLATSLTLLIPPHPAQAVAELAKEHVISFGECEQELMAFLKEGVLIKVLARGVRGVRGRGVESKHPTSTWCESC